MSLDEWTQEFVNITNGKEVPHPNLFPADSLFKPTENPRSRAATVVRHLKAFLGNWDRAQDPKNHYYFDRLVHGEMPGQGSKSLSESLLSH